MIVENMRIAKKSLLFVAGAIVASLLSSCHGGSNSVQPANIRVVDLVNSTSASDDVILTLNATAYTVEAQAGNNSGGSNTSDYVEVTPSTYTGAVVTNGDSAISGATIPGLGLATGQYYTVFAYPREGVLYPFTLIDNVPAPATGEFELSVANASPDAGAVDVYLIDRTSSTAPSDACSEISSSTQPNFPSVQGQQTSPQAFTPGSPAYYDVCVTGASNQSDPRLSITGLNVAANTVYMLALTSASSGTLVNAALIPQTNPATSTLYSNPQFRVRVLTALSSTGSFAGDAAEVTVTTSQNSTAVNTVLAPITSGNASPYSAIALSTGTTANPTIAVTVGSSTLSTSYAFASGGDYTILVYESSGALAVNVLTDNNHYISGKASVRLVNAADASSIGTTMYINNVADVDAITLGNASSYVPAPASSDVVDLSIQGLSPPVSPAQNAETAVDQQFSVGEVYTVFLYDLAYTPRIFQDNAITY